MTQPDDRPPDGAEAARSTRRRRAGRDGVLYDIQPFIFDLVGRAFGSGVYGNDYIQCTSGCPTSTTRYLTINDNHIAGIAYLDASISVKLEAGGSDATLTFVVNNLTNRDPVPVGNGPDGNNVPAYAQTNRTLCDVIGRTFRVAVGVRF